MIEFILGRYNYWIYLFLMMIGFYAMIAKKNFLKKLIGMNIFQTSVFLYYISLSDVKGGTAPILLEQIPPHHILYTNPLPSVLILTAIVVLVSTSAVAFSLVIRIYEEYGTMEEDKLLEER